MSVDDKSWVIIFWLSINYFLSIVYLITSIAIAIEWYKRDELYDDGFNENMLVMDFERGINSNSENNSNFSDDNQRNLLRFRLNKIDLKRLRKSCVISKKEIIKIRLNGHNCSICFDTLENLKKPIIKLPKCDHLFHWK